MQVVDALASDGEDGMLRYLGISYGTALGATVAAMFPDRVDRVVLDGVLNMDQYYAGKELQQVTETDNTWAGFFSRCVETPKLCALAQSHPALSAKELQHKVNDLLKTVRYRPIPLGLSVVDYSWLKTLIFTGMYVLQACDSDGANAHSTQCFSMYPHVRESLADHSICRYYPVNWPDLALALDSIYTGNATAYELGVEAVFGTSAPYDIYPQYQGGEALIRIPVPPTYTLPGV